MAASSPRPLHSRPVRSCRRLATRRVLRSPLHSSWARGRGGRRCDEVHGLIESWAVRRSRRALGRDRSPGARPVAWGSDVARRASADRALRPALVDRDEVGSRARTESLARDEGVDGSADTDGSMFESHDGDDPFEVMGVGRSDVLRRQLVDDRPCGITCEPLDDPSPEGDRSGGIVGRRHRYRHSRVAAQVAGLARVGAGEEHDVLAVGSDPDRDRVGRAVGRTVARWAGEVPSRTCRTSGSRVIVRPRSAGG